ncbi:U2 small nuclear ribonucleoprotein auxiliary factor subunit-related protein 1, putative isoform, partial [Thalictrum thalictroides]
AKYAKLVTIHLDRLVDSCATDAMAHLCWQVFNAFRSRQELVVKEQHRAYELTKRLWAEQEKKESGQDQLDLDFSSKKQKLSKTIPTHLSELDPTSSSEIISSKDKSSIAGSLTMIVSPQLVPAYRRQKVRGVFLGDSEDDAGI